MPFLQSRLVDLTSLDFSVDGRSTCESLAVFPRLKGRTKLISILPFWLFDGVGYQSLDGLRSLSDGYLELFFSCRFC
jgi:hypothetical protein